MSNRVEMGAWGAPVSPESSLALAEEDGPSPELLPPRGEVSMPTAHYAITMPTTQFTGPNNLQAKADHCSFPLITSKPCAPCGEDRCGREPSVSGEI